MWPFRKKITPQERVAVSSAKKGRGAPARVEKSNADIIGGFLPAVFQRTDKNFALVNAASGSSMDAALEECGSSRLPDIYSVQDTMAATTFGWYAAQSFIGYQACAILAQHWLIDKACSQAPKDAVQNGFAPGLIFADGRDVSPSLTAKVKDINKNMDIIGQCREAVRNARIFGVRHVLFEVDGVDYEAPFNEDGVTPGSYRGISQIDPYWLTPEFDTESISIPSSRHFYEPTWWRLTDGRKVHRSHFVILKQSEVPDILKPTYYYGGLPMPQLIYERVYAAERTANEAPELAMTKRLITMQADLENFLSDENEVTARLKAFVRLRSNYGVLALGDGENINQIDTSLADFDAVIMNQYQLVAAIARTPATKLLGTSPKGFNATGEAEGDSYDQELVSIQTTDMTPITDRHHLLVARSSFPKEPGLAITTKWAPVRAAKPVEKADIALKKAQTAQAWVTAGVLSADEERDRLIADPDSGYAGLASFHPEEDELDDPETNEAEGGPNGETSPV